MAAASLFYWKFCKVNYEESSVDIKDPVDSTPYALAAAANLLKI